MEKIDLSTLNGLTVDFDWKSNFTKRCIVTDYNRDVLNYYEKESDYFLMDFSEMVKYGLVKHYQKDGTLHYFTSSGSIAYKNASGNNFLSCLDGEKEFLSPSLYLSKEKIHSFMLSLHNWLINIKKYTESRIICVEIFNALSYYSNEMIFPIPNQDKCLAENALLRAIYDEFRIVFPNSNMIKMPSTVVAIQPHKWGLHPLHFCPEAYDYIYECVDLITKGSYVTVADKYLSLYTDIISYKYTPCTPQNINPRLLADLHYSEIGWISIEKYLKYYGNEQKNRLEAFKIMLLGNISGSVCYQVNVNNRPTWTDIYSNGQMVGTTGLSLPINGIKIWLEGHISQLYSVKYEAIIDNTLYYGQNGESIYSPSHMPITNMFIDLIPK